MGGLVAAAGALAIALLVIPGSIAAQPTPPPSGTVTGLAAQGQALFQQTCAACHGPAGQGGPIGPDITSAGPALADFVLRTGRMPPTNPGPQMHRGDVHLDEQQIEALVAYVASLGQGGAPIPSVVTEGADVANGRDLFVANCAACHGPAGGGGAVGGGFVAPPLDQATAEQVGEAVLSGPGQMPRFSFSPEQLDDLAAYVGYLQNAPHPGGATSPVVGPVTEGFIAGVVLIGLLLVVRWIGVRQHPEP